MELKLSPREVILYNRENRKMISMCAISSMDYISFRCCYFNFLLEQAYVLASQAIEKQLKAHLLFLNPDENLKKYSNHKLIPLINRIESLNIDYNLSEFRDIAEKLWISYEKFRYPDNKVEQTVTNFSIGGDCEVIDKMYLSLLERLPIPKEVKYKLPFYYIICSNRTEQFYQNQKYWALVNNKPLNSLLANLIDEFNETTNHFNNFK